jgi:hypothetical protein
MNLMKRQLRCVALPCGLVVGLAGVVTPVQAIVTPIARYNFEGGNANDPYSGLNGTLNGTAAIVADANANRGMVLQLDGIDADLDSGHVDIADPTGLLNFGATGTRQGSVTVAAWVYSDDWTVHSSLLNQGEWRNGIGFSVKADSPAGGCTECSLWVGAEPFNDPDGLNISVPANEAHRSDALVPQSDWHHVATTWDYDGTQTTINFYLDGQPSGFLEGGVMAGRVTPPIDNDGDGVGNTRIGAEWRDMNPANLRWVYSGLIDDLMIFDTALNAAGINDAMNGNVSAQGPAGLVGDYNANGAVDAADYALWRDTRDQTVAPGSGADGDKNGTIDQNDYSVWRANFGATTSAASGAAAVPEPSTSLLLLAALCSIATSRRSTR